MRSARSHSAGERGFTLIEVVVLVAIVALLAGVGVESLGRRPAQAHATAVSFAALVDEARALAAVSGDANQRTGTGATLQVVRDGDTYVVTLYTGRPVAGVPMAPALAPNTPPLRTSTALGLEQGGATQPPPFALFFSASGHVSARAPFTVGTDPPLATEPNCPPETGIVVAFADGVHDQAHAISCEMARLDLRRKP